MPPREMTEEEKFEVSRLAFGQILLANSRTWEGYRKMSEHMKMMKKVIADVRAACDDMELLIQKAESQPVRVLSEEEYNAKVAAGKKIELSKGGKY